MVITGTIRPEKPSKEAIIIPANSCMRIQFEDVSVMDTSSTTIAETQLEDFTSEDFNKGTTFSMYSQSAPKIDIFHYSNFFELQYLQKFRAGPKFSSTENFCTP